MPCPLAPHALPARGGRWARAWGSALIVGSLLACSGPPRQSPGPTGSIAETRAGLSAPATPEPLPLSQPQSRWVPVPWSALPGWEQDPVGEAWPAWQHSCSRPSPTWARLCAQLPALAQAPAAAQRRWLMAHVQPYRVESLQGQTQGLLTGYFEPLLKASRVAQGPFVHPLYAPPAGLGTRQPWYSRQDIDTLPAARKALQGRALMYLADPVDALVLHIQGSGLAQVTEASGQVRTVRLAFAGTNGQPYKSVGRWLLDQGQVRDASWPGIKAWVARHPQRVQEMLWQNPRYVFFREEPLPAGEVPGPKGAQGVPLTAGRSIAVDPGSIPYGTPVWLSSSGAHTTLQRLVLAQDTGSAIVGAVRADYYAGSGDAAGELAGRLQQNLQLWVLWPR